MNALRTVLIQQASGRHAEMLDLTAPVHQAYADRHAFTLWSVRGRVQFQRPAVWDKVLLLDRALRLGFDLAVWLDADTLIVDPDADVREAIPDGPPIGMCRHPLPWGGRPWHFNAGVIFARGHELAQEFFKRTWQAGPVSHPWQEQHCMNQLAVELPGSVQQLEDKWNSTVGVNEARRPVIRAWHGRGYAALGLIEESISALGWRQARAAATTLTGTVFDYERRNQPSRAMSFSADGRVRMDGEPCGLFWSLQPERNHLRLVLSGDAGMTARLSPAADDSWEGNWMNSPQMPVTLGPQARARRPAGKPASRRASRHKPCLICVATKPDRHFERFLASCARQSIQPIVLGAGGHYGGHGTKFRLVKKFIETEGRSYSHVILCDAYDLVLAAGFDEMLDRFERFHAPIVFSAERICAPDHDKYARFPPANSPYLYLNSGFWIAQMDAARAMTGQIKLRDIGPNDDQRIYTELFLQKRAPIALDYHCRLCQNLSASVEDLQFDPVSRVIFNKLNGSAPCVFHGCGRADLTNVLQWLGL